MKSFKIDRTKIISVVIASMLLVTMLAGCKKKPVVTSMATTVATTTTAITTAETTTEETTTEETTTTEEITTTTTEEETTTKKKKATTAPKKVTTVGKVKVTAVRFTCYAKGGLNVRSGPGTNYKIVKTLKAGDGIDVRGKTNNGWYKTINGNYVKADLTTRTKPANANTGNFE